MIYNFIIKLLVLETVMMRVSLTLNVRTALFSQTDLAKNEWDPRDVALLKARMYLQDLIPPMEVSQSPEYVSSLLRYIRNCYASVNREALDSQTESVLTDALSDVIGGYLKMVALPVTKSVYYSGGLPTRDALQIFKYYEDIKHHLHTRGTGWANQVTRVMKTNNVRGARSDFTSMKIKQPCQRLLYLQNTQQNLTMPMPSIDWNTRMMFVPLTDQPIVDLRSPYIAPILQKFHQVATTCERSVVPDKRYFQDSFEDWVNEEVVPHLSDDDLYIAFKGILSLIESSKLPVIPEHKHFLFMKPSKMSTNSIIIISILILELICCIPTLLYLLKKKKGKSNTTLFGGSSCQPSCTCHLEPSKVCYVDKTVFKLSSHNSLSQSQDKVNSAGDFTNYKKYSGMMEKANSDLSSVSGTRRSYSSITDVPTVVEEIPPTRKHSKRDKKIQPSSLQLFHYQQTETDKIDVTQGQTQVSTRALLPKATSTSTEINFGAPSRKNVSNDTVETITLSTVERDKSASKPIRKSKRFRKRPGSPIKMESNSPLSFSQCMLPLDDIRIREKRRISQTAEELKLEIYDDRLWDKALTRVKNEKRVEFASPHVSVVDRNSVKINEVSGDQSSKTLISRKESIRVMKVLEENQAQKIENQDRPTLEIRIDRGKQHTHTQLTRQVTKNCEGTSKNWKGILKGADEKPILRKTSKIPKRISSSNAPCETSSPVKHIHLSPRRKSLIPTPKRALDDSAILSSSPRDTKFNITL